MPNEAKDGGADVLLRIKDGIGTFASVAGLRVNMLRVNGLLVDLKNANALTIVMRGKDTAVRVDISGNGVFRDASSDALIREHFFDGLIRPWQIAVPKVGTFTGLMQVTALEYSGEHNGEVAYHLALNSEAPMTFERESSP